MLKQGDVLTLDNNKEYVVVSTANLDNNYYLYLVDLLKHKDVLVCQCDNSGNLTEIVDEDLLDELTLEFLNLDTVEQPS